MSRVYDNWERLVVAVLKREELRRLALCESFSSSISADFSSRFSFDSAVEDVPAGFIQSNFSYRDVQPIAFIEIRKATRNFRPEMTLGEREFGQVFKGWIDEHTLTASKPGSGMAVAVKKWEKNALREHQDWLKAFDCLNQLRHPNLAKLIGYCSEEDSMILVYEFMPKGSLANHLFGRLHQSLSWATRIKVAIGVAKGLSFLHEKGLSFLDEKEITVTLGSFKTADILLDGEFNAKLENFAFIRDDPFPDIVIGDYLFPDTALFSTVVTCGCPPEYMVTGDLTTESDVFRFGVILLELLSGRRACDTNRPTAEFNLVESSKPYLDNKRKLLQIMDTRLEGQYPRNEAYTVAKLALKCLNSLPKQRPRMAEVVVALERL